MEKTASLTHSLGDSNLEAQFYSNFSGKTGTGHDGAELPRGSNEGLRHPTAPPYSAPLNRSPSPEDEDTSALGANVFRRNSVKVCGIFEARSRSRSPLRNAEDYSADYDDSAPNNSSGYTKAVPGSKYLRAASSLAPSFPRRQSVEETVSSSVGFSAPKMARSPSHMSTKVSQVASKRSQDMIEEEVAAISTRNALYGAPETSPSYSPRLEAADQGDTGLDPSRTVRRGSVQVVRRNSQTAVLPADVFDANVEDFSEEDLIDADFFMEKKTSALPLSPNVLGSPSKNPDVRNEVGSASSRSNSSSPLIMPSSQRLQAYGDEAVSKNDSAIKQRPISSVVSATRSENSAEKILADRSVKMPAEPAKLWKQNDESGEGGSTDISVICRTKSAIFVSDVSSIDPLSPRRQSVEETDSSSVGFSAPKMSRSPSQM